MTHTLAKMLTLVTLSLTLGACAGNADGEPEGSAGALTADQAGAQLAATNDYAFRDKPATTDAAKALGVVKWSAIRMPVKGGLFGVAIVAFAIGADEQVKYAFATDEQGDPRNSMVSKYDANGPTNDLPTNQEMFTLATDLAEIVRDARLECAKNGAAATGYALGTYALAVITTRLTLGIGDYAFVLRGIVPWWSVAEAGVVAAGTGLAGWGTVKVAAETIDKGKDAVDSCFAAARLGKL
jgi:hypothetical protein